MKSKQNDGGPGQTGADGKKRKKGSGGDGSGGGRPKVELPSRVTLLATVIACLRDARKLEEARWVSLCGFEFGRVRAIDGDQYKVDVTLVGRVDVLRRLTTMSCFEDQPEGLRRVRNALKMSLPGGYQLGALDARVTPVTGCGLEAAGLRLKTADGPQTTGQRDHGPKLKAESGKLKSGSGVSRQEAKAGRPAFMFRKAGSHWDVAFSGGEVFHLDDMLGARYLNCILHEPNQAMWASELEVAVMSARGGVRTNGMAQDHVDSKAVTEYLRLLDGLRADREKASDDGDAGRVAALDAEIEALESQTKGKRSWADSGEKSRNNVRHAIRAVIGRLARGTESERAFAKHLQESVSLGYRVMYKQPLGRIWK